MRYLSGVKIAASIMFLFYPYPCLGETIVLNGTPKVKVESSQDTTFNETLSSSNRDAYRLLISKQGSDYIWITRDNRRLVHRVSGAFHIFYDPLGSGYIKVVDRHFLMEDAQEDRYAYMEHVHSFLGTITYWGFASKFDP